MPTNVYKDPTSVLKVRSQKYNSTDPIASADVQFHLKLVSLSENLPGPSDV